MYLNHYQLQRMPFEIGPDPKFLWLGSKHKEAFAILRYGILESKGFIVIIGDPGTGKSTLLNATAANFGDNVRFAKIGDPALNEMDFFNFTANAFEMGKTFASKADFLIQLNQFVRNAGAQSKKVILVIDEAQRLTPETLEQIRVFSNVETPGQKVVSCIFAGQTEFLDMVKQNRALMQRIFFSHMLQPLTHPETGDYIAHRLKVAGAEAPIFTEAAVQEVFRLSGGNPRLINILCDQALLSGYALDQKNIGAELIKESTENTLIPLTTPRESPADSQRIELPAQSSAPEPTAESTADPAPVAPRRPPRSAFLRQRPYWAPVALIAILGLAAFSYFVGGFRAASTGVQTDSGQAQRSVQPSESTLAAAETGRLQGQMVELRKQKDDAETRLRDLQTRLGALENSQQEMKIAQARVAELESAASGQASLRDEMDRLKKDNNRLQTQLVEVTNQKGAAEARLGEALKQNAGLAVDSKALQSTRDRVAQLEAAVSERDRKLLQLEQRSGELEKALAKEKGAKDQMSVELSAPPATVADLQKRLETASSAQLKLENDIQNTQRENARLQSQLQELKSQKQAPPPASAPARAPAADRPQTAPSDRAGSAPDPAGVIDYVIKKKGQ
jgi:type II secretory pathway predicted ATPase ExeA/predicted  nucleic acid-binding Zn-ribbon protein